MVLKFFLGWVHTILPSKFQLKLEKRSHNWGPRNLHKECALPNRWRDKHTLATCYMTLDLTLATRYLLPYYLTLATWYLLLVTCYRLLVTRYFILNTWYLLPNACYLIIATWYLLLTTWYLIFAIYYLLLATYSQKSFFCSLLNVIGSCSSFKLHSWAKL